MVQLLLDREATANLAMTKGATALFIAVKNGHLPVAQLLLDRKSSVN